jgi:hypothetical protein
VPGPGRTAAALFLALFFLGAFPAFAQEEPDSDTVEESEAAEEPTVTLSVRDQEIIELDIKTSTLSELAAWCRSLGLSEGGDREALGNRIREHYRIAQAVASAGGVAMEIDGAAGPKIITIESARSTEYFTLDVVDEEYARLRGDVVVSLKDGDSVHRITAWELLYNRSRNLLSASGGVEYVKESGDTIETFRGESIVVDLDNWSSVFMDGVSERSLSGEDTTYRFSGNIISRNAEEATVLSRASISNAGNEEALWSLSASKIWLLPGSDFAILNGFLKVGEIPVLYIPAFFFPADEVVFHPVLGYRSREGSFFQTTTYILGRPQAEASTETSSISKILGNSSDMEKTQHGIFLRSTGKKSRDPNTTRLSVLLDAYANLGFYAGTELALPKKGIFNEYKLSLGLGRTRDVMKMENNSVYTPFPNYDGTDEWNSSYLGELSVPFRFRMTNAGSLSGKYGTFTWSLPHYSDPYVDRDFLDRSEEMDYVKMLKNDSSATETEENLTKNLIGSYEWRLGGSSTFSVPSLAPYVTSLSVSNISSFITFYPRESESYRTALKDYSPNYKFFYPDKFTIYSISAGISGTPLSLGGGQTAASPATQTAAGTDSPEAEPDLFKGLGVPSAPWEEEESAAPGAAASRSGSDPNALTPPAISQRFDLPRSGTPRFSIAYQLSPTSATELKFDSTAGSAAIPHWNEAEDVDWSDVSSVLFSAKSDGSLTLSLSDTNNLATASLKFTGSGSAQKYTYLSEDSVEYDTEAEMNTAKIRAMNQTSFTSSTEFIATVRPFYLSPVWSNTNFQYSVKGLIAKSVLKDAAANIPDDAWWDVTWGDWDRESLDNHRLAANLQASVMNKVQNLSVTAEMPPEESSLTGDATMRVWISETNFNGKIRDPYEDPIFDPLRLTETLRFNSSFTASQTVTYDPEKEEFTSMISSLSLYGLTASFTSTYTATYKLELDPNSQWKWNSYPESFEPQEFRLAYVRTFKKDELWEKRLSYSLGLNTSLALNLQRFTNSNFNFTLNFTLGISKFLDITLGTTSTNASIYRYFRDWGILNVPADLPVIGETNVFTDLFNSFRFDDEALRKDSGFKLKSFNLTLLHHLGDWNAKLNMTLSPYLPTGEREYKFNTEISFVVQWLPISEIKTEIIHKKDTIEFK